MLALYKVDRVHSDVCGGYWRVKPLYTLAAAVFTVLMEAPPRGVEEVKPGSPLWPALQEALGEVAYGSVETLFLTATAEGPGTVASLATCSPDSRIQPLYTLNPPRSIIKTMVNTLAGDYGSKARSGLTGLTPAYTGFTVLSGCWSIQVEVKVIAEDSRAYEARIWAGKPENSPPTYRSLVPIIRVEAGPR